MTARAIVPLLLLCAIVLVGDAALRAEDDPLPGRAAPETDPFLAALAGKSGPEAVAAPDFDPEAEACSWTTRPRREIVDGLAARWLRGEAAGWSARSKEWPALPVPPSRIPADFDSTGVPVTDRLAAWVPGDAAALFFPSLKDAEATVEELARFLTNVLPTLCDDPRVGRRDAIARATTMLLLPTIWGANPEVRTGTRQVALVMSDPDLRWVPDIAFVAEVDDASLVRSHRQASLRWEARKAAVLRVEGLDAVTDDGSVRSYFALEGGMAVWATSKSLRERVLAAGATRQPSLLQPDSRAYTLARRTFPSSEGGALLVVPDAFVERASSAEWRARRAAALRCEALRLILDGRSLGGTGGSSHETPSLACPSGGVLRPVFAKAGFSCSLHGTVSSPEPLGDLPVAAACPVSPLPDIPLTGSLPVAARWTDGSMDLLVPPGGTGNGLIEFLTPKPVPDSWTDQRSRARRTAMTSRGVYEDRVWGVLERLTGLITTADEFKVSRSVHIEQPPATRSGGGVLRAKVDFAGGGGSGNHGFSIVMLSLEWR